MTNTEKNLATITHLSALSQYFIPFGNFIVPVVLWSSKKEQSDFIDQNGKEVINFQLSLLVYILLLGCISLSIIGISILDKIASNQLLILDINFILWRDFTLPIAIVFLFLGSIAFMKSVEFILIIIAAVSGSKGKIFHYPLTIKFLK